MQKPEVCSGCGLVVKKCETCMMFFQPRRDKAETARFCGKICQMQFMGKESARKVHEQWANESPETTRKLMQQAFEFFVTKTETCWLWNGSHANRGYGSFRFRGQTFIAHRASYMLYKGDLPSFQRGNPHDLLVLHSCDVRACVNPDHLWLGTHLDNERDKLAKGRHKGEKLNPDKVREIKKLLLEGVMGTIICRDYNISRNTLHSIKIGKTWKDIV